MRNKEDSIVVKSDSNYSNIRKPLIHLPDNKSNIITNLFNTSNDSVINNSNNEIIDADDENDDDINDINEENIFDKSIGDQILLTPINDTHRLFSNKNRFGKTFINSIPLRRIMVPKSKSPNIKSHGSMRNRNENNYKNAKNVLDTLRKGSSTKNEIFSLNSDFLHCRNCMLIVALSKYGKYSFNK